MNPTDRQVVAVFGASQVHPGDGPYQDGVECGKRLAEAGFAVATGGYGGIMEAVCRGAAAVGGPTIGITAPNVFPERTGANDWVQHEIKSDDLVERIGLLTEMAAGCIAMPGSVGTLAELVVAWNLAVVAPFANLDFRPVVAVGDVWQTLVPQLTQQLETDGSFVTTVATVEEAVAAIVKALTNQPGR